MKGVSIGSQEHRRTGSSSHRDCGPGTAARGALRRALELYRPYILSFVLVLLAVSPSHAQIDFGGDARFYLFLSEDGELIDRQDSELGVLRLKLEAHFADSLRIATHGVVGLSSPPALAGSGIVSAGTRRYFDLQYAFIDTEELLGVVELDRLYLRWDRPSFRLTVGRQAVTWGVNYFWPVLDLFAPFTPEQIDRDYKPGIDSVRATISPSAFSQVDVIFAAQGKDLPDDLSLGSLGRFQVGTTDVAFMAGSFHTDVVGGGFVSADVAGTGLRGEVAYTKSGDERDAEIDRERFVRATFGVDRQLSPTVTLVGEISWNGFGADDPAFYPVIATSDRFQRGEVNSLGQSYTGISISWQLHPLWTFGGALLNNWTDTSALIQPSVTWNTSDSIDTLFGLIIGVGPGFREGNVIGSEYGVVPTTIWGAVKGYF